VQEAGDQATMLSLVACGLGVAFVTDATRWRCPRNGVLRKVVDLRLPIAVSLVWRRNNTSPLLARFVTEVRQLPQVRTLARAPNGGGDPTSDETVGRRDGHRDGPAARRDQA
jgi:DNA-binding transcriptional LysR family regulator